MTTLSLSSLSNFISAFLSSTQLPNSQPKSLRLPKSSSQFAPPPPLLAISALTPSSNSASIKADDVTAVLRLSLAYAKSSNYNVEVIVEEDETEDQLLKRFNAAVYRSGVLQECKRRRFFETNQEKRKRKKKEAARKNRKRRPYSKAAALAQQEKPKKDDDDIDDDNWELPEEGIPC